MLHGAKSLAVIVAALSWQTLSQVGPRLVRAGGRRGRRRGVVVCSVVSWLNTGYYVVGPGAADLRRAAVAAHRAIPLERLQAVELVRPLLAQLTGLAELRLEVVGGGKTEAPLAYLTVRRRGARCGSGCSRWPGAPQRRHPPTRRTAARRACPCRNGRCTRCATGTW